jgi:nucleoside-diphosphate-sugar epimerase
MTGSRVTVIGGAGYVGSILVRKLLAQGYGVRVMDALMFGDDAIKELYDHPAFDVVQGDLRSLEDVSRALNGSDAVVHLGGLVGDPACALDESLTMEINLTATGTVADVALGLGITRMVYASTCSVYGANDEVLDEETPLAPVSIYARSKMESERLLLSRIGGGLEPVILRFGTMFGASPRPRFDLVVNLLTAKAMREGQITINGGEQWRPFVHVDDVATSIVLALAAPAETVAGQIFNVGSDENNYTLIQVAEMIERIVPSAEIVYLPKADAEANYRVSFEKIRSRLGFVPRITLEEGLLELKASIEAGAIGDHADVRYSNHKTLLSNEDFRTRTVASGV